MANDFFHIPDNALNNQVFYAKGNSDFQIWTKPQNCKLINIFCLGSGAGGGGGQASTSGTSRRGGGGGGSAGYSLGFFSASQLPDTLFLQIPSGGAGGIGLGTSSNGSAGALSYVSVQPNTTAINLLLVSGAIAPTGGVSGANGGTGGTAGTVWGGGILNALGLATATAGQNGIAGLTTAVPTNLTIANIVTGGGAGAGTNGVTPQAGGNITGSGFINTISGGAGSSTGVAGDGSGGYFASIPTANASARQPMFFTGGAGGGSSNTGTGGNGGAGAYGCGGAGGGAGVTSLAGNGGRGGDGLIIITCW